MKNRTKFTIIATALLAMFAFWLRADQCLSTRTVLNASSRIPSGAYAEWTQPFYSGTITMTARAETAVPRIVHLQTYVWFNNDPLAMCTYNEWFTNVTTALRNEYVHDCFPTNYAKVQLIVEVYTTNGTFVGNNWVKVEQPSNAE